MSLTFFALTGSALVGLGIYGLMSQPHLLRRVIAFNIIGSGLFLFLGAAGARRAAADPIPQALIITGIVVALSASALAVALVVALARSTGEATLPGPEGDSPLQGAPEDDGPNENGPMHQKTADQQVTNQKARDQKAADQEAADQGQGVQGAADQSSTNQGTANQRTADQGSAPNGPRAARHRDMPPNATVAAS